MKKEHVKLTQTDEQYLKELVQKGTLATKTYRRALALLELNRGKTYIEVSTSIGVAHQTVSTWAKKYRERSLEFLTDKPRSGAPKKLDSLDRAQVTALACSQPPEGYSRWSLRLLAEKVVELTEVEAISYGEVRRILKKMNLSLISNDNGSSPR